MHAVVDRLVDLLRLPQPLLPAESIGARRPGSSAELPAIACSVAIANVGGRGLGRFVGSKHLPMQLTTRVVATPGANGFSSDLRRLRLQPPVRRNPAPTSSSLDATDIGIVNVTASPAAYRVSPTPMTASEYAINLVAARVTFGAPQAPGDTLEVTSWTTEWHEPMESDLVRGTLAVEVWGSQGTTVATLARGVHDRLQLRHESRPLGFLRLDPARLEPVAPGTIGASGTAWMQRLEYAFAFESNPAGARSEGGIIRHITAEIDGQLDESLSIPTA